jgi:DNA-directed RNA polymerase subunit RPC12/RpoP
MTDNDDFDMQYIYGLTLKCTDCGLIFRKEHEYVCPACHSRRVARPVLEEFIRYYEDECK